MYIYSCKNTLKAVEKMGEFMKKCENITTMRLRDNNDDVEVISSKRMKFDNFSDVNYSPETLSVTTSSVDISDEVIMKRNLKSLDLKVEGFETDNSATFNGGFSENFKRVLEENYGDSEEMENKKSSSAVSVHRKPPSAAVKIPPEGEIEEFFAAAEKREQKRFSEKYNYDIVKDVPLEGRYQWVSLKP